MLLLDAGQTPTSQRAIEQERSRWSEREFVEQHPGLLQVERIETLGEPAVDRSEKVAGLLPLALLAPQPRHARCCAKLPRFGLLPARHRERTREILLCFCRVRFG